MTAPRSNEVLATACGSLFVIYVVAAVLQALLTWSADVRANRGFPVVPAIVTEDSTQVRRRCAVKRFERGLLLGLGVLCPAIVIVDRLRYVLDLLWWLRY